MSSWLCLRSLRSFFTRWPRFLKNFVVSVTYSLVRRHEQKYHEQISVDYGIISAMFYQNLQRDFYDPSLPPWLPPPPPPTDEQVRIMFVIWFVTWGTWLAVLFWKDRDAIRLGALLMKCLVRRYVLRSEAIQRQKSAEEPEEACKPATREVPKSAA